MQYPAPSLIIYHITYSYSLGITIYRLYTVLEKKINNLYHNRVLLLFRDTSYENSSNDVTGDRVPDQWEPRVQVLWQERDVSLGEDEVWKYGPRGNYIHII